MTFRHLLLSAAILLCCTLPVHPVLAFQNPAQQRWAPLLLELSSTYVYIAREARIDQDSSLIYVSRSIGLSRLEYILRGMDASGVSEANDWFDRRAPGYAVNKLPLLKGNEHLKQLVLLGAYYAFEPLTSGAVRDSSIYYLSRAIEECAKPGNNPGWRRQWRFLALTLLAKYYIEGPDLTKGKALFEQLTAECQNSKDPSAEARGWFYHGYFMRFSIAAMAERISCLQQAARLYEQLDNKQEQINCYNSIGLMLLGMEKIEKAREQFLVCLRLENEIGFPFTHYTIDKLARTTILSGKYGEPLGYAFQTIKTATETGDTLCLPSFYDRLATIYGNNDRDKEGNEAAEKALDGYMRHGGSVRMWAMMTNIISYQTKQGHSGEALDRLHQLAEHLPPFQPEDRIEFYIDEELCYEALKRYPEGETALHKAEEQIPLVLVRPRFYRSYIDNRLSVLYFKMHRYPQARLYMERSTIDPTFNSLGFMLWYQQTMAIMDSSEGHYQDALRHSQRYALLLDSSLGITERKTVDNLTVRYETEKKQQEIESQQQHILQLQKEDRLRATALREANLTRDITIVVIILLLLVVLLVYRYYRQNRKMAAFETQKNELITRKNEQLEQLVEEKNWLLKEVHHRVKNNLHTIICLLESQALYLENDALKAMETSQHRIYAMSLIHQKIYQSEDIKTIDMGRYLPEFIDYLRESFGEPENVIFQLHIDPIRLDAAQAIPVALIINEAVSNSIKYAFPDNRKGHIDIVLKEQGRNILLTITDDGIGMPPLWEATELNSLGIELIKGLSRDLKAILSFTGDKGTRLHLTFAAYAIPLLIRVDTDGQRL